MAAPPPYGSDPHTAIKRLLDDLVQADPESALQVAVYAQGRLVVDAWAGTVAGRAVSGSSLFPIFSTGKGIAATAINRLVERGVLAYDETLAQRWPEFAAQGKGGITLAHALAHAAGMPNLPAVGSLADLCDWDGMCGRLAARAPLHAPGAEQLYHAISQSWLTGEVARRAVGQGFARIIRDEVAAPLGLEQDLFFGISEAVAGRVVEVHAADVAAPVVAPLDPQPAAVPWWVMPLERFIQDPGIRRACIPASNGIATARAIAKHYAALVGEVDGVSLLPGEAVDRAVTPAAPGRTYGMGYALWGPAEQPGLVFGHGGYGGSTGFGSRRLGLGVGITTSRMGGGETERIQKTITEVFGG